MKLRSLGTEIELMKKNCVIDPCYTEKLALIQARNPSRKKEREKSTGNPTGKMKDYGNEVAQKFTFVFRPCNLVSRTFLAPSGYTDSVFKTNI